jgi:hypothetical protein
MIDTRRILWERDQFDGIQVAAIREASSKTVTATRCSECAIPLFVESSWDVVIMNIDDIPFYFSLEALHVLAKNGKLERHRPETRK